VALTSLQIRVDGSPVQFVNPGTIWPGQAVRVRLVSMLNGSQTIEVQAGNATNSLALSQQCTMRLGFADFGDKGGDLLAVIRSVNAAGSEFQSITGLAVSTSTIGGAYCDLAYHQAFTVVESEDLSSLDLLYYHAHSPFALSAAVQQKLADWVSRGNTLLFDNCGGADYADLRTGFGLYVKLVGYVPQTTTVFQGASDVYSYPFPLTTNDVSTAAWWDWGGQQATQGSLTSLVVRGGVPLISAAKYGYGHVAFLAGDTGCSMNCGCTAGVIQAHKLMLNFGYTGTGRSKLIK